MTKISKIFSYHITTLLLLTVASLLSFYIIPENLYASTPDITITWQANTDGSQPNGYKLYYGTESENYSESVDVGNNTSYTLSNLPPGTYYTAITAYNDLGESGYSEETSFVINDLPDDNSSFIETGEIYLQHTWKRVSFNKSFSDPVVIVKGMSFNGPDPAVIRIKNVDKNGFDIRIQEWEYLDGWHTWEKADYFVIEAGSYTLADGTMIEAGKFQTSKTNKFDNVSFNTMFNKVPVLVTAITSFNGPDTVAGRVRDLNTSGFKFCMQEQEANVQSHTTEEISYIAWEPSSGTFGKLHFEVGNAVNGIDHNFQTVPFNHAFIGPPILLADMQTTDGGNTASIRWDNKNAYEFDIKIEEESSFDSEIWHVEEKVGYMAFYIEE